MTLGDKSPSMAVYVLINQVIFHQLLYGLHTFWLFFFLRGVMFFSLIENSLFLYNRPLLWSPLPLLSPFSPPSSLPSKSTPILSLLIDGCYSLVLKLNLRMIDQEILFTSSWLQSRMGCDEFWATGKPKDTENSSLFSFQNA